MKTTDIYMYTGIYYENKAPLPLNTSGEIQWFERMLN